MSSGSDDRWERKPAEPFGGTRERAAATRRRQAWEARQARERIAPVQEQEQEQEQAPPQRSEVPQQASFQREHSQSRDESFHEQYVEEPDHERTRNHGGDNSKFWAGVIGLLIFGLGNYFLYKYTGWLIIPIPRR